MTKLKKKTKVNEEVRKTEFSFSMPQTQKVFIAGDFNHCDPSSHPLKKDNAGIWKNSVSSRVGTNIDYLWMENGKLIPIAVLL